MGTSNYYPLMVVVLFAGAGIPVMAALNSGLGSKLASPILAVAILCTVALLLTLVLFVIFPLKSWPSKTEIPPWYFAAGFLFLFYIFSITFSASIIGLGTAVFLVLMGQIFSAAIIDHWGLFGNPVHPLTPRRLLGLGIIILGIVLARGQGLPSHAINN